MYQVHINGKSISEHGSKEDAILRLTEKYKLDLVNQLELNTSDITHIGKAEICITNVTPKLFELEYV